jgi:hypothetical protein
MRRATIVRALAAAIAAASVVPCAATAQSPGWEVQWNLRARYEHVDDAAFDRDADAATLRLRAGLHGRSGTGWETLVEGDAIAATGDFDDGANGKVQWPAVIDPPREGLNQAWLRKQAGPVSITAGRQRLLYANQRWIGNSGWRQHEQTFDAVASEWKLRPTLVLRHAWLGRVHRVAGDDARDPLARGRRLDSHYVELAWQRGAWQIAPYALLHRDRDVAAASTATRGVRAAYDAIAHGRGCRVAAEFARQVDAGANPRDFAHDYRLLAPACAVRGGVLLRAGIEQLGGDGAHALQAPLGTLHAFDGWADRFNATPPGGLDDRYLGAGGAFGRARALEWQLAWHDYHAEAGRIRYGSEWNVSLGFPLSKRLRALAKAADYRADGFGRDARKLWLQLEWVP